MLVKYLRALLGQFWSKKDNDEIANLSAPKGERITLSPLKSEVGEWEAFQTYTAPCSGWITLVCRAVDTTGLAVSGLSTGKTELGVIQPRGGYKRSISIRVAKGQSVDISGGYIREITIRFTKDN